MTDTKKLSRRRGYRAPQKAITVREDAPESLREAVLQIAADLGPSTSAQRAGARRAIKDP